MPARHDMEAAGTGAKGGVKDGQKAQTAPANEHGDRKRAGSLRGRKEAEPQRPSSSSGPVMQPSRGRKSGPVAEAAPSKYAYKNRSRSPKPSELLTDGEYNLAAFEVLLCAWYNVPWVFWRESDYVHC